MVPPFSSEVGLSRSTRSVWDPGGSYGSFHQEDIRSRDLILISPPDLKSYLQFTWIYSSVEAEVFEWDLTLEHAREMYEVLLKGTDKNHPAGRFQDDTYHGWVLLCCVE